jgi:hypothetical protein
MRTTVDLDDDTAAAIERLRRREGIGLSEAVNRLVRQALVGRAASEPVHFTQRTAPLGVTLDVSNVAEALEVLDGPRSR